MNRGVLQTSTPVQQIMAGNPNWWNINNMRPPPSYHQQPSPFLPPPNLFPQFTPPPASSSPNSSSSSSSSSSLTVPSWSEDQIPDSWNQLLLGGLMEEDKGNMMGHFQAKKLENWEEQMLHHHHHQASSHVASPVADVKQENSATSFRYGHASNEDLHTPKPNWSQMIPPLPPVSSPTSCLTTSFTRNILDFSTNKGDCRHAPPDRSSECNSTATGGAVKKARVQPSSNQSTFKVRKEKLGDRITALHQLVSPFGKTDTASVLLEAIGYIRFLQSQIEALSSPYLAIGSSNTRQQQQQQQCTVQGERGCIFPEDPGQLLNDNCIKRKGASDQLNCSEEPKKDLRSRGLCLVPVSCTLQVGSDNGADYWAPALGGGFR